MAIKDYIDFSDCRAGIININEWFSMTHGISYSEPIGLIKPFLDYGVSGAFMVLSLDNVWLSHSVGVENVIYPLLGLGIDAVKNRGIDEMVVRADSMGCVVTRYFNSVFYSA